MSVSRLKNSFNPKKVLIVVPGNSSFRLPLIHALNNLKIQTHTFDNRKTTILEKFVFASSKINRNQCQIGVQRINQRLLKFFYQIKPDLVIVIKGENLLKKTVHKISEDATIINLFPDYLRDFKYITSLISTYSLFFHIDKHEVQKLNKQGQKNIYYLPFAAEIHFGNSLKKYPISFVGSYSLKRERLLLKVKNLPLFIWGDKAWSKTQLKSHYQGKWVNQQEMTNIFHQSKIIINIHQNSLSKNDAANLRCFEVTGAGQFLLSDYRGSFKGLFNIGDEIECYRDNNDLRKKIIFYLNNEELREKIAKNGLRRVKKDHTYEKRLKEMFSIIAQRNSS